jgi:hypothetical protein
MFLVFLFPQISLFVDIYNECAAVQQLYIIKDNTSISVCNNKERFKIKGTEARHLGLTFSHHQFTAPERVRTASRNGDIAFAIGRKDL